MSTALRMILAASTILRMAPPGPEAIDMILTCQLVLQHTLRMTLPRTDHATHWQVNAILATLETLRLSCFTHVSKQLAQLRHRMHTAIMQPAFGTPGTRMSGLYLITSPLMHTGKQIRGNAGQRYTRAYIGSTADMYQRHVQHKARMHSPLPGDTRCNTFYSKMHRHGVHFHILLPLQVNTVCIPVSQAVKSAARMLLYAQEAATIRDHRPR